jgi:hypothetical protein
VFGTPDVASKNNVEHAGKGKVERETGIEPATFSLGS